MMAGLRILMIAIIGMWCSTANAQENTSKGKKDANDKAKSEALQQDEVKASADTSAVKKGNCIIHLEEIDYRKEPE